MSSPPSCKPFWWKPNDLSGIDDDRTIIDYLHEIPVHYSKEENISTNEKQCRVSLDIVKLCLYKYEKVRRTRRNYMDYLRWNKEDIFEDLEKYLKMAEVKHLHPDIHVCKKSLEVHFCLSEEDKGLIHKYMTAFNKAKNNHNAKLVRIAACRFVNVFELLYRKGIVDSNTYEMVDLDELMHQGYSLLKWLPVLGDIDSILQRFEEFCVADSEAKAAHEDLLDAVLKLEEVRADEKHLESLKSQYQEYIQFTDELLKNARASMWSRLWYNIRHPLQLAKSTWRWWKQNPVKAIAIIVGVDFPLACFGGITTVLDSDVCVDLTSSEMVLRAFSTLVTGVGIMHIVNIASDLLMDNGEKIQDDERSVLVPWDPENEEYLQARNLQDRQLREKIATMNGEQLGRLKESLGKAEKENLYSLENIREEHVRIDNEIKKIKVRVRRTADDINEFKECLFNVKNLFESTITTVDND